MSLNRANSADGQSIVLFNGEWLICYTSGCELVLELQSGGQSPPAFKGSHKGDIYLTSHRMIFLKRGSPGSPLKSFALPFVRLQGVNLEQPIFGSNHLKGNVHADPDPNWANWAGTARFKLYFPSGGCIEFGEALLNAVQRAMRGNYLPPPIPGGTITTFVFMGDPATGAMPTPPPYEAYVASAVMVPPPAYTPPDPSAYAFMQPAANTFSTPPPTGSVLMCGAPPPYPGVAPYVASPMAPPPPGFVNGPQSTFQPQPPRP